MRRGIISSCQSAATSRDCKVLLVVILTRVSSAIAPLPFYLYWRILRILNHMATTGWWWSVDENNQSNVTAKSELINRTINLLSAVIIRQTELTAWEQPSLSPSLANLKCDSFCTGHTFDYAIFASLLAFYILQRNRAFDNVLALYSQWIN